MAFLLNPVLRKLLLWGTLLGVLLGLGWFSLSQTKALALAEAREETALRALRTAQDRLEQIREVDVHQEAEKRSELDPVRSAVQAERAQEKELEKDPDNADTRAEHDRLWLDAVKAGNRAITSTR